MILETTEINKIADLLNQNKIGVMPTDTVYGIHCKVLNPTLMDQVYNIKQRPKDMPFITLIQKVEDLELFDIIPSDFELEQIKNYWPGPNTLIFETSNTGKTLSFRIPDNRFLHEVLKNTGPLISTSANLYKQPTSTTIDEAINYFGDKIDFYVDGGELKNPPSSIYKIENNQILKIR